MNFDRPSERRYFHYAHLQASVPAIFNSGPESGAARMSIGIGMGPLIGIQKGPL